MRWSLPFFTAALGGVLGLALALSIRGSDANNRQDDAIHALQTQVATR